MVNDSPLGPIRAGALRLPGNLFLAPVAGYTDRSFRSVCLEWGADLCYTEMVSAEALTRDSAKTMDLLARAENEDAYAIQLFGHDPGKMARAAAIASRLRPALIDVNAGCPVPKVTRTGAGSALMRNPGKIREIIAAMAEETDIPVTVKFRLGWDASSVNFLSFAEEALKGGAAALCLHARTKAQGYAGKADWASIAALKRAFPEAVVFASGDVSSPGAAARVFEETGCDGAMIARGALGDPFIFTAIKRLLSGGSDWTPTRAELASTLMRHLDRAVAAYGEPLACMEFRKHFCEYAKGIEGVAALRREAVRASTRAEFASLAVRLAG
jgi:tRNA-dihydrouridine synthase B